MVFALLISLLPAPISTVYADVTPPVITEKWEDAGNYSTTWYDSGVGTESEPYSIQTAEDLAGLIYLSNNQTVDFMNKYIRLDSNIDLSGKLWTAPFGKYTGTAPGMGVLTKNFCGVFDGNGKTISGMTIVSDGNEDTDYYLGLFATLDVFGTIKNLTLTGSQIYLTSNPHTFAGLIVGRCSGALDGVKVEDSSIHSDGASGIGGLVGGASVPSESSATAIISNSHVKNVNITIDRSTPNLSTMKVGGVVGDVSSSFKMANVWASGLINSNVDDNITLSGLIAASAITGDTLYVDNCYSLMNITDTGRYYEGETEQIASSKYIMGLFGKYDGADIGNHRFSNLYYAGTINSATDVLKRFINMDSGSEFLFINCYYDKTKNDFAADLYPANEMARGITTNQLLGYELIESASSGFENLPIGAQFAMHAGQLNDNGANPEMKAWIIDEGQLPTLSNTTASTYIRLSFAIEPLIEQTIPAGSDVNLIAVAYNGGTATIQYEWFKKTSDLWVSTGETSSTLSLTNIMAEDEPLQYKCVAKDGVIKIEAFATINVTREERTEIPTITVVQPEDSVRVGKLLGGSTDMEFTYNGGAPSTLPSADYWAAPGEYKVRYKATGTHTAGPWTNILTIKQPMTITNTSLPYGVLGQSFSAQIQTSTGFSGEKGYEVYDGVLPDGLSLNASTGAITGTPTATGQFPVTIGAAILDSETGKYSRTTAPFTIKVYSGIVTPPTGLTLIQPNTKGGPGFIHGTSILMEYSTDPAFSVAYFCDDASTMVAANPTSITTYYVRFAEDGFNTPPSPSMTVGMLSPAYKVNYEPNGGTGMKPGFQLGLGGKPVTAPTNTYTKAGYEFVNWWVNGNEFAPGSTFTMPMSDITLAAIWSPLSGIAYKVEHYTQNLDGTYDETPWETETLSGSADQSVQATIKTYQGYVLDESNGDNVISGAIALDGSTVLKVYYERYIATLTFQSNGGTSVSPITITYGAVVTPPVTTKTGYFFNGWFTGNNGAGAQMTEETIYPTDRTYYAYWGLTPLTAEDINKTYSYGNAVSENITVSGGSGNYTFNVISGTFPTGLSINSEGRLSGTANELASSRVIILKVRDNTTAQEKYVKLIITVQGSSSGGSSGGGGSSTPITETPKETANTILVGNKEVEIGASKTETISKRETETLTISHSLMTSAIKDASRKATVEVVMENGDADVHRIVMPGSTISELAKKDIILAIRTGDVSYSVPMSALNIGSHLKSLDSSATLSNTDVSIEITKASDSVHSRIQSAGVTKGFTVISTPVEFDIKLTKGKNSTYVKEFGGYLERRIEATGDFESGMVSTVICYEDNGTIRHIPTKKVTEDGKTYIVFKSRTNSTYAMIYAQNSFADTQYHWAAPVITDMANRKILSGVNEATFNPDNFITRAEFAKVIVSALGLPEATTNSFRDVNSSDWFAGAVGAAFKNGLIQGKASGIFDPNGLITRQEAMVIIKNAGLLAEIPEKSAYLTFPDAASLDIWAESAAKYSVGNGLFSGYDDGKLYPKKNITRAQTATIVSNMLKKADLI